MSSEDESSRGGYGSLGELGVVAFCLVGFTGGELVVNGVGAPHRGWGGARKRVEIFGAGIALVGMRGLRNFQPGRLYGITQRGNKGQWVCRDEEDFARSFELMRKYTARYGVKVHGWCVLHNHGHWIFEASDAESISNAMRDMQGQFSRFLNQKYRGAPWLLFGSLGGSRRRKRGWTRYLRAGPTNWSPRFDAQLLSDLGFKSFLRYVELNRAPRRVGTRRGERPALGGHRVCLVS